MTKGSGVASDAFEADLTIPPFGLELRFGEQGPEAESGEVRLRPWVAGPPVHIHVAQDERFSVRTGRLRVLIGRTWHDLGPGRTAVVPRGTPHTYRNGSSEACVFEYRLAPGGRFARMMREFADLAARGKLRGMSSPRSLMYLAMVFVRYGDEVQSVRPPMSVMRGLAWLERLTVA